MNTYIVYYKSFTPDNVLIEESSIVIEAISANSACKKASMEIDGKHSIQFASQIKGPVSVR